MSPTAFISLCALPRSPGMLPSVNARPPFRRPLHPSAPARACVPQPGTETRVTEVDTDTSSVPASSSMASSVGDTVLPVTQALLDDLAERPEYYLNVVGVLLGLGLIVVVLSATMAALDSIPLVPDVLRVVGLGYLFWFLGKFLLSGSERRRLQAEIDEFVHAMREDGDAVGELTGVEARRIGQAVEKVDADLVM